MMYRIWIIFMEHNFSLPEINEAFSEELFQQNLNSISKYDSKFAEQLDSKKGLGNYSISLDKGLENTLIVNGLQLSSRYDRLAFANYRCRNIDLEEDIFIYGLGIGDELALLSNNSQSNIYVIILNPGLLYELLGRIENFSLYIKQNIHFVIPNDSFPFSTNCCINPVELYIEQHVLNNLKAKLINIIDDLNLKNEVDNVLLQESIDNLKENYELLKNEKLLDHNDLLNLGKRIAIAAPGPSIQDNIERIKALNKDQVTIVTVDVALKFLLENGIIPDVIVTCDSKMSPEKIGDITPYRDRLNNSLFIFCANSPSSVISLFNCEKRFIFKKKQIDFIDYLPEEFSDFVQITGSVLNVATEIASAAEPDNILLFGTDFAFSDNQTHAGKSDSKIFFRDIQIIKVLCNDGAIRNTVKPFTYYRYLLEQTIQNNPSIRFDNYSKTGAVILGTNLVED